MNFKTIQSFVGAISLIHEPTISAIWENYMVGVNITKVDCPKYDEKCFIEEINNKSVNQEDVITTALDNSYVSILFNFNLFKSFHKS